MPSDVESPLVEFARRAIDSYVLMFPDDPEVIRWKEMWAKLRLFGAG